MLHVVSRSDAAVPYEFILDLASMRQTSVLTGDVRKLVRRDGQEVQSTLLNGILMKQNASCFHRIRSVSSDVNGRAKCAMFVSIEC